MRIGGVRSGRPSCSPSRSSRWCDSRIRLGGVIGFFAPYTFAAQGAIDLCLLEQLSGAQPPSDLDIRVLQDCRGPGTDGSGWVRAGRCRRRRTGGWTHGPEGECVVTGFVMITTVSDKVNRHSASDASLYCKLTYGRHDMVHHSRGHLSVHFRISVHSAVSQATRVRTREVRSVGSIP
jgi:hypothetical protein